eukprot:SAG31_NODE_4890_length_2882_cov_3.387352_3_plen_165_part_00
MTGSASKVLDFMSLCFDRTCGNRRRHHDHPTPTDYFLPSQRTTKVFVALWDIPKDGGCTALVPRTHRLPGCFLPGSQVGEKLLRRGFRTHARRHDEEGMTNGSDALPQEAMPNHVKMAIPAGSAFLFDSSVWHTCELMHTFGLQLLFHSVAVVQWRYCACDHHS